ncbi:MAG: diguanylate cyclase, partial [Agathobacter sp.]|nr:diguanylate cyclase [Agathobacter sp.]
FMIGRGLLFHPNALLEYDVEPMNRFKAFHDELVAGYEAYMCGDRNVLFKMKELWGYWSVQFQGQEKLLKQIKKVNTLAEYRPLVNAIIQAVIE